MDFPMSLGLRRATTSVLGKLRISCFFHELKLGEQDSAQACDKMMQRGPAQREFEDACKH